jgi:hypothetical protein
MVGRDAVREAHARATRAPTGGRSKVSTLLPLSGHARRPNASAEDVAALAESGTFGRF